jgi:Second Messenger Oligonucleotide or Dinucleotide Synthetase domain/Adenylyl/Guanylyl and SMODS C-terminal sensor domain
VLGLFQAHWNFSSSFASGSTVPAPHRHPPEMRMCELASIEELNVKQVAEFDAFLKNEVNLNKTRIGTLTDRVEAIQNFLEDSDWKPEITRFNPQGSWAHKTIIKPPGEQGFDADLLVFVQPVSGWSPKDYVLKLKDEFKGNGTYKDKVFLHTRSVRLEYSGDFELDVVPCVVNRPGGTSQFEVCNRTDNEFEPTNGEVYTAWLEQRNTWAGTDKLREVTRLLKYLRDIKTTFTCKSILLTTLLGGRITQTDASNQTAYFPDLPTALKTLITRLDDYLQARPKLHDICNPVLPSENFNRHWDQDKYANFRTWMHTYRGWIEDAYNEPDEAESTIKWRRAFGDDFNKESKAALVKIDQGTLVPIQINRLLYEDAVQAVRTAGLSILKNVQAVVPWMKKPDWPMRPQSSVAIRATAHHEKNGSSIRTFDSGQVLSKKLNLRFEAVTPTGIPYASGRDFDVQWQVVNTDHDAWRENGLRGGFYPSDRKGVKWEYTKYRGIHWVEAFVIKKRSSECVARSGRFFVVIE